MNINIIDDSKEISKLIGHNLQLLRSMRGYSQARVGEELGVSFQQVQKYEKGINRLSSGSIVKLSVFFDCSVLDFFQNTPVLFEENSLDPIVWETVRNFSQLNTRIKKPLAALIKSMCQPIQ